MSQAVEGYSVVLPRGRACLFPPFADLQTQTGPPLNDTEGAGPCPGSPSPPVGIRAGPALLPQLCPWLAGGGLSPHAQASLLLLPAQESHPPSQGHRPRHRSLSAASQGLAWPHLSRSSPGTLAISVWPPFPALPERKSSTQPRGQPFPALGHSVFPGSGWTGAPGS